MKKCFLGCCILVLLVLFAGCARKPSTDEEFTRIAEQAGYTVDEVHSNEGEQGGAGIRATKDGRQLVRYTYFSADAALEWFSFSVFSLENYAEWAEKTTASGSDYEKVTLISEDYYCAICRVGSTYMISETPLDGTDDDEKIEVLEKLTKKLGYSKTCTDTTNY